MVWNKGRVVKKKEKQIEAAANSFEDRRKSKIATPFGVTLIAMCISVCAVFFAPMPLTERFLQDKVEADAKIWRDRVLERLESGASIFNSSVIASADNAYLESVPETTDIYRLNVISKDGEILWSSHREEIGAKYQTNNFFDQVMAGENIYVRQELPATEIDNIDLHAVEIDVGKQYHVAEIITPVTASGQLIGALAFHEEFTFLYDTVLGQIRTGFIAAGIAFVLVIGASSFAVHTANRRQFKALEQQSRIERESLERQMKMAREVQLLGELNEWLQSSSSLTELFDMVGRYLTHILPDAEGSIYVYSNSRDVLDGWAAWNGATYKAHIRPDECWGLRRGRTYAYGTGSVNFACDHTHPHDERPYFCFPILAHGETVGLMHLQAGEGVAVEQFRSKLKLGQMCAEQISMAIANVQMRDELHDQSVRDPLTGLFNRRHMTETMRSLTEKTRKTGDSFALISVDVDHFKRFNDTHGHDAGDMVLRAVGTVLEANVDGDELACRMGGEEFMLLLPETDKIKAVERAEKLRKAVEAVTVRYGEKVLPKITISIGVAMAPEHGTLPQDIMKCADDALYAAKDRGRNQVVVASFDESEIEAAGVLHDLPEPIAAE